METPEANQLPEVDSLPDGFVESPSEPLAPKTPISEQEKPLLPDYKEDDLVSTEFGASKGQKQRTFPVPLSEGDSFDASLDSVEGKLFGHVSSDSVPEAAEVGVVECSEVKGEIKGECQTAERCNFL